MITIPDIQGKNIIVRADLDVPVGDGGVVSNTFRLEAILPTLRFCAEHASKILVIGHMGRPKGEDPAFSLVPVQKWLKSKMNQEIRFIVSGYSPGDWWKGETKVSLLENLRFFPGEESFDNQFANDLVTGAQVYVYEAFASYNPSTSTQIIPKLLPTLTGFQFDKEISTLTDILKSPQHPTLLLASGAKEDKLEIIHKITPIFDKVLLGGKFAQAGQLTPDGLDMNEETTATFVKAIEGAKTVVMNGPLGKYEDGVHIKATKAILEALKKTEAFTILGGGDTLASIPALDFSYVDFDFVSTGGGAMLDFLATGTHPLLKSIK